MPLNKYLIVATVLFALSNTSALAAGDEACNNLSHQVNAMKDNLALMIKKLHDPECAPDNIQTLKEMVSLQDKIIASETQHVPMCPKTATVVSSILQESITARRNNSSLLASLEGKCSGSKPQGSTASSTEGLCGSLISTTSIKGSLKAPDFKQSELRQCIEVTNKCPYDIDFRVRRSGLNIALQEKVAPGKTGKICADSDDQTVSYMGMKQR